METISLFWVLLLLAISTDLNRFLTEGSLGLEFLE